MSTERPTPETYACIVTSAGKFDCLYPDSKIWRLPVPAGFAAKLERERDEVREKLEAVSKSAERIRCELVEKEKQLEAMRSAIRSAYSVLDALATFHRHSPLWATLEATDALNKLKPFTQP